MTSKRRVDPEARPGELLSAARTVFSKKGVANSSVSDIVEIAGVVKGTFYLYFTSKEAIIHAVVKLMSNDMVDAAERVVAEIESGAE